MPHLVRRLAEDRPLPERVRLVARQLVGGMQQFGVMAASLCEGASLLARRLRMPDEVARTLGQLMSRWDGNGVPADVAGEEISRPLRIVRVAHDLVALAEARDLKAAIAALRRRRGRGYDPEIVDAALAEPDALLRAAAAHDAWEWVIALEPEPVATISSAGLDTMARAFGEFVDLKVGFLRGIRSGSQCPTGSGRSAAR
jgi:HD domain